MGERAASVSRISGKAICCGCGGDLFQVVIYNDAEFDVVCFTTECRQIWAPLGEGSGTIARISEALDPRGHVTSYLVSQDACKAKA